MKKKIIALLLGICTVFTLVGCTNNTTSEPSEDPIVETQEDEYIEPYENPDLITNNYEYEVDSEYSLQNITKLVDLVSINSNENVILSETSLNMALSLLLEGSKIDSDSNNELIEYLSRSNYLDNKELIRNKNNALVNQYNSNENITISIANSLWTNLDTEINSDYEQILKSYYDSTVQSVNFSEMSGGRKINNWCKSKTNGLIDKIVDPGSIAEQDAILINALYFLGDWSEPFDEEDCKEETFTNADGSKSKVTMMYDYDIGIYYENDKCEAFKKYYNGYDFAFVGILPKDNKNIVVSDLGIDELLENSSNEYKVNIKMPKFKLEYDTSLKASLQELGLTSIFTNPNDFAGSLSTNKELEVSDIIQKTVVDVNETGTEAAAVTAIMMNDGCALEPEIKKEIKTIYLDRPFVFMIYDNVNHECLFIGKINNLK